MWRQFCNSTSTVRIVKLKTDSQHWERAVYPFQVVKFWAISEARLEVYSCEFFGLLLEDRIPCSELEIPADWFSQAA